MRTAARPRDERQRRALRSRCVRSSYRPPKAWEGSLGRDENAWGSNAVREKSGAEGTEGLGIVRSTFTDAARCVCTSPVLADLPLGDERVAWSPHHWRATKRRIRPPHSPRSSTTAGDSPGAADARATAVTTSATCAATSSIGAEGANSAVMGRSPTQL